MALRLTDTVGVSDPYLDNFEAFEDQMQKMYSQKNSKLKVTI